MDIYEKSDLAVLELIGKKIKEIRIEQNITQNELNSLSGVSKARIGDIERGKNCSLLILIQLLRGLNSLDFLDSFFAEKQISPIEYAKLQGLNTPKQRARKDNIAQQSTNNDTEEW